MRRGRRDGPAHLPRARARRQCRDDGRTAVRQSPARCLGRVPAAGAEPPSPASPTTVATAASSIAPKSVRISRGRTSSAHGARSRSIDSESAHSSGLDGHCALMKSVSVARHDGAHVESRRRDQPHGSNELVRRSGVAPAFTWNGRAGSCDAPRCAIRTESGTRAASANRASGARGDTASRLRTTHAFSSYRVAAVRCATTRPSRSLSTTTTRPAVCGGCSATAATRRSECLSTRSSRISRPRTYGRSLIRSWRPANAAVSAG